jgi:rSAM/selenodomain-associated transferase 2
MLSVVIPTLNAEQELGATLSALVPAAVEGLVRDVVVVDGGSTDATLKIADACGATILKTERGRGRQLRAGADAAKQPWLLFLHADTVLTPGWERDVWAFVEKQAADRPQKAATFRFSLDDTGLAARLVETGVALRTSVLKLPYGDQGLLISKTLYRDIGGYPDIPLMEDVALVRKLGRRRLAVLRSAALTSAARYRRDGYARRIVRNLSCLVLYASGVPAERISRIYDGGRHN